MAQTETHSFQAETKQLLELMVHSLYSHKDIFIRELVSNASDALDKLRFESLSNPDLASDKSDAHIRIEIDKDTRTLTISDNGIGMSKDEVIKNIGTIAQSGTRELWQQLQEQKKTAKQGDQEVPSELIGQFGVGFYSAFMVADRVTLVTRRAGEETATHWESEGKGEYLLSETTRSGQGTSITLHLREADKDNGLDDFADPSVIRAAIKRYSDFVRYPIRHEDNVLNSGKAIWRKRSSEVSEEEYNAFYKQISYDWTDPLKTITIRAEGRLEYYSLLYLPAKAPFDLFHPTSKTGPQLYVKNVKIMDHCEELLPRYLRFVRGVVDSSDLPLNVSREILQHDRQLQLVKKGLTKKVLDALGDLQKNKAEQYQSLWTEFGNVLKEGIASMEDSSDKLKELLLFASTHDTDKLTTLDDYVARMPEGQEEIYYLTGESREVVSHSPHLEAFAKKGFEVLLLVDPIDEFMVQSLAEFKDKKLQSAAKGSLKLNDGDNKEEQEKQSEEFSGVLLRLQKHLDEHIKEVRLSTRLTDSPVCLVTDEKDISPGLEKLLRQGNQEVPKQKRILEINPDHPVSQHLKQRYRDNSSDPVLDDYADLLFGQARLAEGALPLQPSKFTQLVSKLMTSATIS